MGLTRRGFLKAATTASLATMAACRHTTTTNRPGAGPRWGMVIDLRRCLGCHACSVACKAEQDVPLGYFKSWVQVTERGTYPNASRHFVRVMCNHCDEPPCVEGCPTGATWQREDGVVAQSADRCIGCGYCIQACPYGVKYQAPRTGTAEKCDLCIHRIEQGLAPACVNTCNGGALIFGDLNDPSSRVSQLISKEPVQVLQPEMGTQPRVFYIGLDAEAAATVGQRPRLPAGGN